MANKKVTYDIDFRANDAATPTARRVTEEVKSVAAAGVSATSAITRAMDNSSVAIASASTSGIQSIDKLGKGVASASDSAASAFAFAMQRLVGDAEAGTVDLSQSIAIQKRVIKDLEQQYVELQKKCASAPTNYAKEVLGGRLNNLGKEIKEERDALDALEKSQDTYKQSTLRARTEILNLQDAMTRLRRAGKAETAEYDELRSRLEEVSTAYREVQKERTAISTGASDINGLMSGLQGLMGAYAVGSGVVSLFVSDNEKLQKVQTKMQSTMSIMIGLQQVANTLHATSAFRITTVRKATALWSSTNVKLTTTLGMSAAAANVLMGTLTLGLSVAITAAVVAVSKLIDKKKEEREAAIETAKAEKESNDTIRKSVASNIGGQLVEFRKLQNGWRSVGNSLAAQTKYIKDNKTTFDKLGLTITDAKSAEDALIDNEQRFISSLRNKALATAAMETAAKHYENYIAALLDAENQTGTIEQQQHAARHAKSAVMKYVPGMNEQNYRGAADFITGKRETNDPALQRAAAIYRANYNEYIATVTKTKREADRKAADVFLAKGDSAINLASQYNSFVTGAVAGNGSTTGDDPRVGSIAAIEAKLKKLGEQLKASGADERADIQKTINAWQNKLDVINAELALVGVPAEPMTFKECISAVSAYDAAIKANHASLKTASASERHQITTTISALKEKKKHYEQALIIKQPINAEDYKEAISYFETLRDKAVAVKSVEEQMLRMFGKGNVDLLARPMIDAADLVKKGWKDAGEGIATVFSSQYGILDANGNEIELLVTPILPNGTVLSPDELGQYIDNELNGAQDILKADTKGIVISVGVSSDGSAESYQKIIVNLQTQQNKLRNNLDALSVPTNPQTLQELSEAIAYYEKQLKTASVDERAEIQKTINAYRQKERAITNELTKVSLPINPQTIEEFDSIIDYYERMLLTANKTERAEIQKTINAYRQKERAITNELTKIGLPINPQTTEEFDSIIDYYERMLLTANKTERAEIKKTIAQYRLKQEALAESLNLSAIKAMLDAAPDLDAKVAINLRTKVYGANIAKQKIEELKEMLPYADAEQAKSINASIKYWSGFTDNLAAIKNKGDNAAGTIDSLGQIMQSVSGVVDEGAAGWLQYGANIMSAIAAALPVIAKMIGGNVAQAFSGAIAQSQTVPFPLNIISLAASLASVGAAVAAIPKYAEGGIAYGATLGVFGEYSGVQSNPEVVAPLNKLRKLIGTNDGGGTVEFKIAGRYLRGILEKDSKRRNRTK